jgi:hypothetical protein
MADEPLSLMVTFPEEPDSLAIHISVADIEPPSLTSISPVPLAPQKIRATEEEEETVTEEPSPLIFSVPLEPVFSPKYNHAYVLVDDNVSVPPSLTSISPVPLLPQ